ncbi:MAG: gliding motility-associated C-terminal domain-containing protein [Bacteroidia bacterium]
MKGLFSIIVFLLSGFAASAQYQFIENQGQWNKKVLYRAYVDAGEVFIENDGIRFMFYDGEKVEAFHKGSASDSLLDCHSLKLKFLDAQKPSSVKTKIKSKTEYNYYLGNNKAKWVSGASAYEKIVLENIYEGIDFEIYSYQFKLKYNFYVHPGADASPIKIKYLGADDILLKNGNLQVNTSLRNIFEEAPFVYQNLENEPYKEVASSFILDGNEVTFDVKDTYRKDRVLVIDPTLVFATFSGSTADNFGFTATYDEDGNAYSGGTVYAFGFPTTNGAYQLRWLGGINVNAQVGDIARDIGILKYSEDGTKLLYATYIGGSHNEDPHSMVVNSNQELLVFGNTASEDFPTTISAHDTTFNGRTDIYVAHLSSNGRNMLNCSYIGGTGIDGLNGQQVSLGGTTSNNSNLGFNYGDMYRGEVIVDEKDYVYVSTVTRSSDFPVQNNSFQRNRSSQHDAVVIKLEPDLSDIVASTYFGGSDNDAAYGISLDDSSNIFICGGTNSDSLPFNSTAYSDTFNRGIADGFIAKFDNNLTQLLDGTFFGTRNYDQIFFIQIPEDNQVYVTGQTTSENFPVINAKYSQPEGKQFIAKFGNRLDTLFYSSVFGSGRANPDVSPSAFLVDQCARIYFSGWGGGANFSGRTEDLPIPDSLEAEQATSLGSDFYLAVFAENMDTILYGSYFGGDTTVEHVDGGTSRYDRSGIVYQAVCAGCGAGSSDFPVTSGVWSEKNKSNTGNLCNNALFKLDFDAPVLFADFDAQNICIGEELRVTDRSINAITYLWDYGNGQTSSSNSPSIIYKDTGLYTIQLIVENILSCPGKDTFSKTIRVYDDAGAAFNALPDDCGWAFDFKNESRFGNAFRWTFGDGGQSNLENPFHSYKDTGLYSVNFFIDEGTACADSLSTVINIQKPVADFTYLADSCEPYVNFFDNSNNSITWLWEFEPGRFSDDQSPGFLFSDTGSYQIMLKINPDKPCFDSVIKTIKIENYERLASFDIAIDSCNFLIQAFNTSKNNSGIKWLVADSTKTDTAIWETGTPGIFEIKLVADPFSGCPDTSSRFIQLNELPSAQFELLIDTCLSKIETINKSQFSNSFKWQVGDEKSSSINPIFSLGDTGTFAVLLVSNPFSACADTFIEKATINTVKFAEFETTVIPCSNSLIIKNLSINAKTLDWDYGAANGEYAFENDTTIVYNNSGIKTITLIIDADDKSCSDTFSQSIQIIPPANANFSFENEFCESNFNFFGENDLYVNYKWLIDDSLASNDPNFSKKFNDTSTHSISLTVIDSNGCEGNFIELVSASVISKAKAQALLDSCSGNAELFSESTDATTYQWSISGEVIGSKENKNIELPEANKPHKIELIINEGTPCADTANLYLQFDETVLENVFISNVFSPNGDGKNDIFKIDSLNQACDETTLYIYNRWGVMVHETSIKPLTWNGKNAIDLPLNNGVYFYLIEVNGEQRTGSITLVR